MKHPGTIQHSTGFVRRYTVYALLIFFGYMAEVCLIPYIKIWDVSPNLLYAVIGIITIAYGKLRAFWAGLIFGLLMQIMLPSFSYLNLALYPITTLFCSFAFADKPLKRIEYEKATNRTHKELPPWLRTVLCAVLNVFLYEIIQVTYIYIGGSPILPKHILRAVLDIFLTGTLTFLLLFPVRAAIMGRRRPVTSSAIISPRVFRTN